MTFQRKMHKALSVLVLFSFVSGQILPPAAAAQPASVLNLPMPGAMVGVSPKYVPIAIKGIKIFPDNPFRFDFLLDTGNSNLNQERLNEETKILIKYFLTALTIPDQDQWVNLSPVEHDRIVPNEFGVTEMGRDLLAQDYLLKQLTASLIYPEHELGKKFWENVYRKAYEKYGDADIPMSTFNKVWIMPDHATVYQNGNTAVITESRLKVLLEEDYLALSKGVPDSRNPRDPGTLGAGEPRDYNTFGSQIVREIVLPEIEREVNEGKNFARLRQVYRSMIMAAWFKRKLKDGIINKMYVGQNKVAGVDVADKEIKEKVYQQYLAAYKKGVYNYIKEDVDPRTHAVVPRKYFSGGIKTGVEVGRTTEMITVNPDQLASAAGDVTGDSLTASIGLNPVDSTGKGVEILNRPEISLPIDVKRRLDDNVGFLMDIVKAVQSSVSQRGGGIYQYHLYLNNTEPSRQTLPEKFRERFQEIDDPQEIRYFARALSREWKNNGFDKDFGSVFEYVAQTLSDYVGTPSQIKKMYAWMYTFLEESEPLERVYALRLLIVSFINHLRRNGLHPENENNQFGLSDEKFPLDMELLLGNPRDLQGEQIVQRYILGLLELQKTSQWTEVIPGIDGQPNKLGLTHEDMLLWGLALAVDPTIYYEGVDEESRPYPTKDIGVYLSKYFGEEVNEQNAGVKFLQRAFSHESLKDKRPQIEALLIKALGISDQQWADKGQRSPYRFAFNLDYLGSIFTGTSIWDESLRILGNPMLMLGFDFSYWSGPSKLMLQPSSNSTRHLILRKQGEQGLRPLYVHAFASPELAAIFPDLAEIIRGKVNGIPGGALKDLSVFDPDKPAPAPSDVTLTVWKRLASNATVQLLSIADQEINAKIIEVDAQQMPEGMTAYHFIDEGNALVIVLSSDISDAKVRNEVIFHEAMEANWSDLLMAEAKQPLTAEGVTKTKRDVHILAWAEQVVSFGQTSLTPLHQQQIALLSVEDREALKAEKTREYQDALIKQYFPLDRYEEYLKYKQRFQDALTKSAAPASVDPALIPKVGTLLTEESLQALAQFNLLNAEGLKRMLPVGKIVTADFLEGVAMLTRLLNVEPGPNFGIRGGALARTDKDIYSALSDMLNVYSGNLSFEDRERLAATLARMKEGSLQLLNIMGVINDNEFELLKSKDATGLKNLNAESKQEFLDRLAALVGSYDGLAKTNKTGLMIRLVPLKVIDLLMEYFGSSRATVQTVIRGHPDFPAWLVAAELKVQSIQKLVSGPRNAWIVVQAQGLEKTDEWIEKARVIVDKIQPLVGSRGQAWHIIIIQGIDKAGDWAEKAHVKVLAIQDKVGGSSNAWQIVVRQGIEKVDAWVEKAQKKVSAILPVVGSETNAWLILIGLGTDGTDAWLKSRKQQAEELQRSGQTVTTAWKNIIRTSLFSDEDGGLENGRMSGDTAT
ncbi:MAG: hypothetical protein KA403_05235, partial [Candidatus Omnitrophica bacterium]|nr:hypothetical protein [Candidatus Omnitrophota bacterium]